MNDINKVTKLMEDMERLRKKLYQALDEADGNQQDPKVQELADEFDRLLNEYMNEHQ